ncbi:exonuclease domain-containing protein [Streptomyces sp. NPDC003943]
MDALANDPRFAAATFLVIDFEGLASAGPPAQPIEVAALALRPAGDRPVDRPVRRAEAAARRRSCYRAGRPAEGTHQQMLSTARPAAEVLARLEAHLTAPPYRLVAHHASTEAGIIGRQAEHCPVLAATLLLDTLRLARAVVPGLGSYGLDGLLGYYGIPNPAGRHRATPDVEVTSQVLARLLADGYVASFISWDSVCRPVPESVGDQRTHGCR